MSPAKQPAVTTPAACAPSGVPRQAAGVDMVDVILDLDVPGLPPDFELALFREVARLVPWIDAEPAAGIHPVRGTRAADGSLLVARRTKLMIRIPREKICAASVLEGATLAVLGVRLKLGPGTYRRLQPSPTLYSPRVVTGDDDEAAFLGHLAAEVEEIGVRARLMCGRRTGVTREGRDYAAWSVAVHDLAPEASLALQRSGLGMLHDMGCGILAPHKTITTSD